MYRLLEILFLQPKKPKKHSITQATIALDEEIFEASVKIDREFAWLARYELIAKKLEEQRMQSQKWWEKKNPVKQLISKNWNQKSK